MNKRKLARSGIANIWVAIFGTLMIAMTALAGDAARLYFIAQQMQTAADSAALAAAAALRQDASFCQQAAQNAAAANKVDGLPSSLRANPSNAPDGDIVVGCYSRQTGVFTPTLGSTANAVKITLRRTTATPAGGVPLVFGSVYGTPKVDVTRTAIAMVNNPNVTPGLLVLNPSSCGAVSMNGNVTINVSGGAIQVNSSGPHAVSISGKASMTASEIDVVGGTSGGTFNGTLNEGAAPVPDPYAALPPPPYSTAHDLGRVSVNKGTTTLNPGYYSGGISMSGNANLVLNPGVYVLDGVGISMSGNTSIQANGVLLYVKGTGAIDLSGGGAVQITPIDAGAASLSDDYAGMCIYQDRADQNDATFSGNSGMSVQGVIYMPSVTLSMSGTSGQMGNLIIVDKLSLSGTCDITVTQGNQSGPTSARPWLVQ